MALEQQLKLTPGNWLAINCASFPSDSHCELLMLAPENQKEDLIAAGVKHAASKHGHTDDEKLTAGVAGMIESVQIA